MDLFAEDSLEFLFSKVIKLHHDQIRKSLRKIGLYKGQPFILFALNERDGLAQKELAEKVHIKCASLSVIIRRMEKAGIVERRKDPDDLRVSRVYLTEEGRNILVKVEEKMKAVKQECFKGFTQEERVLLRRFFLQMSKNLSDGE